MAKTKKPSLICPTCRNHIPDSVIDEYLTEHGRKTGAIGGRTTAKRGRDYYRKLQAQRKKKSGGTHGGRPKLTPESA